MVLRLETNACPQLHAHTRRLALAVLRVRSWRQRAFDPSGANERAVRTEPAQNEYESHFQFGQGQFTAFS
jgi:hypothetical protein